MIAVDKVRYVGEPVVAVAAVDERTAEAAIEAISVDYAHLPHVTEAEDALQSDAPLVHDRFEPLKDFYFTGQAKPVDGTNIFQHFTYATVDPEDAMATAARVFEDSFRFPMVFPTHQTRNVLSLLHRRALEHPVVRLDARPVAAAIEGHNAACTNDFTFVRCLGCETGEQLSV